ncbi:hypothetical protein KBA63_03935 [Candidatus Woesebacteria bacterium]|nr:hypothetical protein [Candidatus Woesebacteria bacterium]
MTSQNVLKVTFPAIDCYEVVTIYRELIQALSLIDVRVQSVPVKFEPAMQVEYWKGNLHIKGKGMPVFFTIYPFTDLLPNGEHSPNLRNLVTLEMSSDDSVPFNLCKDTAKAFKSKITENFRDLAKSAVWP